MVYFAAADIAPILVIFQTQGDAVPGELLVVRLSKIVISAIERRDFALTDLTIVHSTMILLLTYFFTLISAMNT